MAKKSASWKDYLIDIDEKNAVKVYKSGTLCENTMATLREIAQAVGFELEKKWNTQQSGVKLVKYLTESAPTIVEEPTVSLPDEPNAPVKEEKKETEIIPESEVPKVAEQENVIVETVTSKKKTTAKKEKSPVNDEETTPVIQLVKSAQPKVPESEKAVSNETTVSDKRFFGRGDGLHNTDNPREVLKLLTEEPFNLPFGIEEVARSVKAEQLEGIVTTFDAVFYHFQTTHTESAGLVYKPNPKGAKSYKSYRYQDLKDLDIPVVTSADSKNKKKIEPLQIILDGTVESLPCDVQQTCPSCSGNGKCENCRGKGEATCYTCNGTGKCDDCRGKGKVDCAWCNGSGRCRSCNGTGYSGTCKKCKGTGTIQIENGKTADGKKKYKNVRCGNCDGRGMLKCTRCEGSKKCYHCSGQGKKECSNCNGTGRCQTCYGSKKATCQTCMGRGDCVQCNGDGNITCQRCNGSGNYQSYDVLSIKAIKETGTFFSYKEEPKMQRITLEKVKPEKGNLILSWKHSNADVKESLDFCSAKITPELIEALKQKGYHTADKLSGMVSDTLVETEKKHWNEESQYTKEMTVESYGFPSSKYEFDFENHHYLFYVIGNKVKELMGDYPKNHFFDITEEKKGGLFALKKSVSGLFKSEESKLFDRQVALVTLAVWLAKKTGANNAEELLSAFKIEEVLGHDEKKIRTMQEAVRKDYTEKDLYKALSSIEESLAAVVWAYIFSGGDPIAKKIGTRLRKSQNGYDYLDKEVHPKDWMKLPLSELLVAFSSKYIPKNLNM